MIMDIEWYRAAYSVCVALIVCYQANKKKSLDHSGCVAAFIVGTLTFYSGLRFAITMLAFFFSSSKITKVGSKKPGNRNWKQVLCNSLPGVICSTLYFLSVNRAFDSFPFLSSPYLSTFYLGGFLSLYACTTGDTWASEIGALSSSLPILIVPPWKRVPKGTNGAISPLGTFASGVGGLFIGITFYFSTCTSLQTVKEQYDEIQDKELMLKRFDGLIESPTSQYWMIVIALFCGFFGSLLDSILGATLQFSGYSRNHPDVIFEDPNASQTMKRISGRYILSNNEVNLISSTVMCFVGGCLSVWTFC